MKIGTKRIFIFSALALAGVAVFGNKKFKEAEKVLEQLQLGIKTISNISLSWEKVKFDIELTLTNPTNINFGVTTTSKIFLKKIRVKTPDGKVIASGLTNIYEVNLPAKSTFVLPMVSIEAPLEGMLTQLLKENGTKNLKVELDIDAFGRKFTIAQ